MANDWRDQVNFASNYPNLAPPKNLLPNADYGRVAALKLVEKIFDDHILAYISQTPTVANTQAWAIAGRYHYYLLGRNQQLQTNEAKRASLPGAPTYGSYVFPALNLDLETQGPIYFRKVLQEIGEMSRTYGIPFGTITSAVLTMIHAGVVAGNVDNLAQWNYELREGYIMARGNFGLIESLWGTRRGTFPKTFYANYNGSGSSIASRQTFSKSRKRGRRMRRGFKRRRY